MKLYSIINSKSGIPLYNILFSVFPTHLTISGVKHHVVQGSKVTLECLSEGASPPAKITWMNDSTPIPADQILSSSVPHVIKLITFN